MTVCKETQWLCENAKALEKFSGQWVAFSASHGLVSSSETFASVLKTSRHQKSASAPFLFHVPSKEDLTSPLAVATKK